jgi:chromosomal replication initiator protein
MMNSGGQRMTSTAPAVSVWGKACLALRRELGEADFGSWLAQAALREGPDGAPVLVTPTGVARDWIRRNAWRRISSCGPRTTPRVVAWT